MSSALVKQALAFVDPEEQENNKNNRRSRKRLNPGQGKFHPYKNKNKKNQIEKQEENLVEKNIQKLLALSAPVAKKATAGKIVERALKGKPLLERVEKRVEEEQSILFPEETFKHFEKSHFCR